MTVDVNKFFFVKLLFVFHRKKIVVEVVLGDDSKLKL